MPPTVQFLNEGLRLAGVPAARFARSRDPSHRHRSTSLRFGARRHHPELAAIELAVAEVDDGRKAGVVPVEKRHLLLDRGT